MAFRIKDDLSIQIIFGEKEFPLDRVNSLDFVHMSASTRIAVPMIHLKVTDGVKALSKSQDLVDGAPIQINLTANNVVSTYKFRLHSFTDMLSPMGTTYTIDGYYAAPLYWLASSTKLIKGPSSTAIKTIADTCGLALDVTATSDPQSWIPMNEKYHQFARRIAAHGYRSGTSCMVLALGLSGKLRYIDVSELTNIRQKATFVAGKYAKEALLASDFEMLNKAGFYNAVSGYADQFRIQQHDADTIVMDKVNVTPLSTRLMMNTDVKNAVKSGRVSFRPIDAGNVHVKYEEAYYQNRRLSNTYMFGVNLVTNGFSNLELLDPFEFVADEPEGKGVLAYSGRYLTSSKTIFVQGGNYFEKIEGFRQGINAANKSQV